MSAVGDFFAGLGQNLNNAIAAPISIVQGYGDIIGSQAAMNNAQADIASSNAAYQLEAVKNDQAKIKAQRQMLVWAVVLMAVLILAVVAVKIYA